MAKDNDRLNHARHNEKVCDYLNLKTEFSDWVITTAFYSSLHYVSYKIFPIDVPALGGKPTQLTTLDEYYNYHSLTNKKNKHYALLDLVRKHCVPISEDYNWLLDMSMNARYTNYQAIPQVANKAKSLLIKIRNYCCRS
jgi:hypothetical protein